MNLETFRNDFQLNLSNNLPLYLQLSNYIHKNIKSGEFKPGEQLITENEFCETLGISRTTVRLALDKLEKDGLIIRRRGKGSFVSDRKLKRNINYMYSFTENVLDAGVVPSSIVLTNGLEHADDNLCELFKLSEKDSLVFKLVRLRCGDGTPLLLETSYIPYYLCRGIEKYDFSKSSLYNILETHFSLNFAHAIETIEAVHLDKESAQYLKTTHKAIAYHIERTSFLESGYVFEYTTSTTRADKTSFRLNLYKNQKTNVNTVDFQRRLKP